MSNAITNILAQAGSTAVNQAATQATTIATAGVASSDVASVVLFYLLAAVVVGAAVGVALSRDIVRMAVCLLFALLGVGGFYFLLGAEFLAAVQLVVYVGGTLMLIVFGVMLTSSSPHMRFETKRGEVIVAVLAGVVAMGSLVVAIVRAPLVADTSGAPLGQVREIGLAFLSDYLLPFELASVILLVVMIGAAFLARPKRERES